MQKEIKQFASVVKDAIGEKTKLLKYELEKYGWKRSEQWVYRQGWDMDDRESIVQRFLIFMTALKRANLAGYELLMSEIEMFLRGVNVVGVPYFEPRNPVAESVDRLEAEIKRLRRIARETK